MTQYTSINNYTVVSQGTTIVAYFGPEFLRAPNRVAFFSECPADVRHDVLLRVATQVFHMTDDIPDTAAELEKALDCRGVKVTDLTYNRVEDALTDAVTALENVGVPLRWKIGPGFLSSESKVTIEVDAPHEFTFWHDVGRGEFDQDSMWSLYIVPAYFPDRQGKTCDQLVNGYTDANVRSYAVNSIMAPPEAIVPTKYSSASWAHVSHPYHAKGQSFTVGIDNDRMRTAAGVAELVSILRNALGMTDKYVGISGGFYPPLEHPYNLLKRDTIPGTSKKFRGSEQTCVWQYRTLEAENALGDAHVPRWFDSEGWLKIYANTSTAADLDLL